MIRNKNKFNEVFLFSLPRSGSTFLSRLLDNHSLISSPPETWLLLFYNHLFNKKVINYPIGLNTCYLAALTFISQHENIFTSNINVFFKSRRKIIEIFSYLIRGISTKEQLIKKMVLFNFHQHLLKQNKSIFVDKTPRNYILLDYINRNFKNSLKIYLRRDPRDIANSYNKTWAISIDEIVGKKNISVNTKDFSKGLVDLEEYFLSSSNPNHLIIDYKELVASNKDTVEKICEFLGVKFEPNMLKFKNNNKNSLHFNNEFVGDFEANKKLRSSDKSFKHRKFCKELSQAEIKTLNRYFKTDKSDEFNFLLFKNNQERIKVNSSLSELTTEILTPLHKILSLK